MSKPLCIYHGNCADGFGAAWAVRHAFGDEVDFHAGVHQDPPPDVKMRDVLFVDFSYKREVLAEIAASARSILILDHHKSAAEDILSAAIIGMTAPVDLSKYTGGLSWHRHLQNVAQDEMEGISQAVVYALFDMDRSGAGLAWDFFFPDKPRPALISHIEDRDLWRFRLSGTREIQANVFSYPYDFDVWDRLMLDTPVDDLKSDGAAIERKHFKDIREFIDAASYRMEIAGHDVPVLNAPYFWSSDAGHIMSEGEPFAACYWDTPGGRVFSLRSADDGLDVSEIAKQFGGGGHKHAAGFRLPMGVETESLKA